VARAMVIFERRADASWQPTTVILATAEGLIGKALPGSPYRDDRLDGYLHRAVPPRISEFSEERGSYEDWIGWAVSHLANGHTTWTSEVVPEEGVDALYQREILIPAGANSAIREVSNVSPPPRRDAPSR
jgi:hypothetical protein